MATQNTTDEAQTATEFIPADEVPGTNRTGKPMVRILQAVDGGVEIAAHEPHDGEVRNHVFVCDECGHDETTEDGISHHLQHNH